MIDTVDMSNEQLVEFAEGLARVASTGGGPKALAAHLAALVGAAVLVEDADWRHVALAGAGSRSIPPSSRELIGSAAKNAESLVRLPLPGDGPEGLAVRIRGGGEGQLGWLSVFPNASSAEGRLGAIRLTAAAIAVELSRDAGGGRNRRKSFWDRLISRAYDDPIEAKDDAAARGITLAAGYVAVAVEAEGLDEAVATAKVGDLRRICLETLRSGAGEIIVLERGGGFVFLCPAPIEVDAANVRTAATLIPRAANKSHFGAKIVGGIGRQAEAIAAYRTVEEARESMFIARRPGHLSALAARQHRRRRAARVLRADPGTAARLRRKTPDRTDPHAAALFRGRTERQDGCGRALGAPAHRLLPAPSNRRNQRPRPRFGPRSTHATDCDGNRCTQL
jgi:hypothetical protein